MRRWGRIALWVFALSPSVTLALLTVSLLASLDAPWPTGYSVWSGEILIPAGLRAKTSSITPPIAP